MSVVFHLELLPRFWFQNILYSSLDIYSIILSISKPAKTTMRPLDGKQLEDKRYSEAELCLWHSTRCVWLMLSVGWSSHKSFASCSFSSSTRLSFITFPPLSAMSSFHPFVVSPITVAHVTTAGQIRDSVMLLLGSSLKLWHQVPKLALRHNAQSGIDRRNCQSQDLLSCCQFMVLLGGEEREVILDRGGEVEVGWVDKSRRQPGRNSKRTIGSYLWRKVHQVLCER